MVEIGGGNYPDLHPLIERIVEREQTNVPDDIFLSSCQLSPLGDFLLIHGEDGRSAGGWSSLCLVDLSSDPEIYNLHVETYSFVHMRCGKPIFPQFYWKSPVSIGMSVSLHKFEWFIPAKDADIKISTLIHLPAVLTQLVTDYRGYDSFESAVDSLPHQYEGDMSKVPYGGFTANMCEYCHQQARDELLANMHKRHKISKFTSGTTRKRKLGTS